MRAKHLRCAKGRLLNPCIRKPVGKLSVLLHLEVVFNGEGVGDLDTSSLVDEITESLVRELGPTVKANAQAAARDALIGAKASTVMTFVAPDGSRYAPAADLEKTPDYVKAIWCFVRDKPMKEQPLDSAITDQIVQAIETSVSETLNSDATIVVVSNALARAGRNSGTVRKEIRGDAAWISREILAMSGVSPTSVVADQVTDMAAHQASEVLNTAAGKAVLAAISQIAASTVGKVMIMKIIQASTISVAKSTAAKAAVKGALKKLGIVVVIKTAVAKVLATMAPGLAAAKIPIFWILLPIVALFIRHEMKNMPKKLSEKVPPQVGANIEESFPEMARSYAEVLLAQTIAEVVKKG